MPAAQQDDSGTRVSVLNEIEDAITLASPSLVNAEKNSTPARKKLIRRDDREYSQPLRLGVQLFLVALNLWIGVQFYLWVRWAESGGRNVEVSRPAGVEGWLPIEGLMQLKYFLVTGQVPRGWGLACVHREASWRCIRQRVARTAPAAVCATARFRRPGPRVNLSRIGLRLSTAKLFFILNLQERRPLMRRSVSVIVMLFLLFPLVVLGQHGGRHGTSTGTSGGTTAPAEDSDVATFKHAIAVQATKEQIGQFRLMIKSTEAARQQALDLQQLGSNASNSEGLTSRATALQDSVDEAQRENRTFRQSLSDSQEAGLKSLTKKLTKADSAVSKDAEAISKQLEQRTLNSGRLISAAANLEKALALFQLDQLNLGKEMGIQSH